MRIIAVAVRRIAALPRRSHKPKVEIPCGSNARHRHQSNGGSTMSQAPNQHPEDMAAPTADKPDDQAGTLSFGQKAVGLTFNPSNNQDVNALKQQLATFIDVCHDRKEASQDPEVKRMYSIAITEAQTAQMWAVKAATWQS